MEVKLLVLIVFFNCSTILLVASHNVSREANYRVFHKHPGIRNCAADILKQNGIVGGRVSNVTGVCEGLNHSWALNQTMQNGYSYLKTNYAKQIYNRPVGINEFLNGPGWLIPGVLHVGAEVQVTISTSWSKSYPAFNVNLINSTDRRPKIYGDGDWIWQSFSFWTSHDSSTSDHLFGSLEKDPQKRYYQRDTLKVKLEHFEVKKRKFTLQAMTDGFKCLFDGKEMFTYQHENFDPKIMRQVYVQYQGEEAEDPVAVHSFEFREHSEG